MSTESPKTYFFWSGNALPDPPCYDQFTDDDDDDDDDDDKEASGPPRLPRMCTVQRKGRLNRDRRKHTSTKSDILIIIDDDNDVLFQNEDWCNRI